MKAKFMLIISIILFVAAIPLIFMDGTHVIGTILLMVSTIINLIRASVNLWSERRLK